MGRGAAGMHHPFRYSLVIEMLDLLPEVKVLHQRRAAKSGPQRVLVVGNLDTLIAGHHLTRIEGVGREVRCLVGFPVEGVFVDGRGGLARTSGGGAAARPDGISEALQLQRGLKNLQTAPPLNDLELLLDWWCR